jgi:glyoxylase-like metal-dependent hydrolase (beta-lactamase superfamily II)
MEGFMMPISTLQSRFSSLPHGLLRLDHGLVNSYFLSAEDSEKWVVLDTGKSSCRNLILETARTQFGTGNRPEAILLTHGHMDHSGSALALATHWNVPVYAHPAEMPFLTGKSDYPPFDALVGGGAFVFVSKFMSRKGQNLRHWIRELPPEGAIPGLENWKWIHTPGHTPGHISVYSKADRLLMAGDAFCTTNHESLTSMLFTKSKEIHRPPATSTMNWQAAAESVRRLAALQPKLAAAGHGLPMSGPELQSGLANLARDFEKEIPEQGRYTQEPAWRDMREVYHAPSREFSARQIAGLAVVCAGAALISASLLRGRKRRG